MTIHALKNLSSALLLLARDLLETSREREVPLSGPALATPFSNISEADWAEAVRLWNAQGRSLIPGLAQRDCPACGAAEGRSLFESYDGYPYVECDLCGCWYVPLRVEAGIFDAFFVRCPEARAVAERSYAARETPEYAEACLGRIGGYLDVLLPLATGEGPGRTLDVGCGLGHSLKAASDRGLIAMGTESSSDCIRIARANGLDVRDAAEPLPSGPFRLITFWESLEHMSDPYGVLVECRSRLEANGLVAFSVPNLLSPLVRLQRADCSVVHGGYDTPGHINLLGPESLRRLLDRSGYALLDLDGQYGLNFVELLAYAAGLHRGAHDLLVGRREVQGVPESTIEVMRWTGPALAIVERIALLSPILVGIACRKEAAERFRGGIGRLQKARKARLVAEIEGTIPPPSRGERYYARIQSVFHALRDPAGAIARLFRRK